MSNQKPEKENNNQKDRKPSETNPINPKEDFPGSKQKKDK